MLDTDTILAIAQGIDSGVKLEPPYGDDDLTWHIRLSNGELVLIHRFDEDKERIGSIIRRVARGT